MARPKAGEVFVKLPVPPELVTMLREYADRGARILSLAVDAERAIRALVVESESARAELARGVDRARRALRRRKKR